MTGTEIAFFGLIAWTLLLLGIIAWLRVSATLARTRKPNSFKPTGEDMAPFGQRVTRAHANCYEHLPFALALLLYAMHAGNTGVTDATGPLFLLLRVTQSSLHLWSTRNRVVVWRFYAFLAQIVLMTVWLIALAFG
ncbi:MAG: MAPEG family protein [Phyllobacteriaceae bacterium]|nr:MAPEG family protein [Phyllobacteriaceae bacterium]